MDIRNRKGKRGLLEVTVPEKGRGRRNSHSSCREITNTNLTLERALNLCTYFALTLPLQVRHKIPEQRVPH